MAETRLYATLAHVIEMEADMPRYRNKENGNEMDAHVDFAAVALPESLYEIVADETFEERELRELLEARVPAPVPGQHEANDNDQDGV